MVFEEIIDGDGDNGDGYERVTEGGIGKGWGEAGEASHAGGQRRK